MKLIERSILRGALFASLVAGTADCTRSARTSAETTATNLVLSPDEEAKLGQQLEAELRQEMRFVSDPQVTSYVQRVAGRIFQAARSDQPELAVQVHVIDDPKTVNAFATVGSQLYVFSGLLLTANDEAELAGVLGHETGHIVARHPARQMTNQLGLSAISDIILGKNSVGLDRLAANAAAKGYLLANSRADETEADELGARFASRAGYDPRALAGFLERISEPGGQPGFLVFLQDHPMTPDRVAHLNQYIAENHLSGTRPATAALDDTKRRLQPAVGGGPRDGGSR